MSSIDDMVNSVVGHLAKSASSKTVAGDPIQLGEVTLVVLSILSIGMGAAGGQGAADGGQGAGAGEGVGGGVKVRPAAVIAFTPAGVEVLPIKEEPGVFDKMVDRVPEVVDMVEKVRHQLEPAES